MSDGCQRDKYETERSGWDLDVSGIQTRPLMSNPHKKTLALLKLMGGNCIGLFWHISVQRNKSKSIFFSAII